MAWYRCVGGAGGSLKLRTASGRIATFNTNMVEAFKSLKSDINPVQSGSGTPSPSNVRPISGFSALNVTRTGKNLVNGDKFADNFAGAAFYNKDTANKTVTFANSTTAPYHQVVFEMPFKTNTQYTFIFNYTAVSVNRSLRIGYTDGTNSEIYFDTNGSKTSVVVTSLNGKTVKDLYLSFFSNGVTTLYYDECGIFEGVVTPADFEPYNGQTATVNFGQTVYGGVADVTNGKLTITHKLVTYSGDSSENWQFINPSYYIASPTDCRKSQTVKANQYNGVAPTYYNVMVNGNIALSTVLDNLLVRNDSISSVADLKTALSNNPLQVLYELATPIEIDTTPENLTAIVGQNNVYADTNGNTEVKYLYRE